MIIEAILFHESVSKESGLQSTVVLINVERIIHRGKAFKTMISLPRSGRLSKGAEQDWFVWKDSSVSKEHGATTGVV